MLVTDSIPPVSWFSLSVFRSFLFIYSPCLPVCYVSSSGLSPSEYCCFAAISVLLHFRISITDLFACCIHIPHADDLAGCWSASLYSSSNAIRLSLSVWWSACGRLSGSCCCNGGHAYGVSGLSCCVVLCHGSSVKLSTSSFRCSFCFAAFLPASLLRDPRPPHAWRCLRSWRLVSRASRMA